MTESWLDKTIGFVSPTAKLHRLRSKAASEIILRHYEGASRGRRTKGWRTSSGSANSELMGSIVTLRDRARYLVRNNPYAARGIQAIAAHTIGEGIIPQFTAPKKTLEKKIADAWDAWGETTACDADGINNFYGLQSLVMREVAEAGEVLVRRRRRKLSDGLPVPMQLQVLEADFLDHNKNQVLENGHKIFQGVEFNLFGRIEAYWLFPVHPGETLLLAPVADTTTLLFQSVRVPASEILHIYRADRAGQVRGASWLAPSIIRLRDFDEYEDAQLLRQKIAACFTAFVYDSAVPELDNLTQDGGTNDVDRIEPARIEFLPNGKDIKFANPPGVEGYGDYSRVTLTSVAASLGITYEALTSDLSNVNFSSGRMGRIEMYQNIAQWRWHMIVPNFCNPARSWFLEAFSLMNGISTESIKNTWTEPKREQIQPDKEVAADNEAILSCQTTLSEVIRSRGYDPAKVFQERANELKILDSLGIKASSDPRQNAPINKAGGNDAA